MGFELRVPPEVAADPDVRAAVGRLCAEGIVPDVALADALEALREACLAGDFDRLVEDTFDAGLDQVTLVTERLVARCMAERNAGEARVTLRRISFFRR